MRGLAIDFEKNRGLRQHAPCRSLNYCPLCVGSQQRDVKRDNCNEYQDFDLIIRDPGARVARVDTTSFIVGQWAVCISDIENDEQVTSHGPKTEGAKRKNRHTAGIQQADAEKC